MKPNILKTAIPFLPLIAGLFFSLSVRGQTIMVSGVIDKDITWDADKVKDKAVVRFDNPENRPFLLYVTGSSGNMV
jgi:hypothetical protein